MRGSNVDPLPSQTDQAHGGFAHVEAGRDLSEAGTLHSHLPDLDYLRCCELRSTMSLAETTGPDLGMRPAPMPLSLRIPALRARVGDVVLSCAEEEMRRIHAGPNVAVVTDEQPGRDWPDVDLIGNTMREPRPAAHLELAISGRERRCRPQPAARGRLLRDLRLEPLQGRSRDHQVVVYPMRRAS